MAQEVETQKFSTSNSGSGNGGGGISFGNGIGRSSKKQKQKKVPQRGLGVAQLEKIRLEEQQKKDGSMILPSAPPISPTKPPITNYQSYTSSVPYPCSDVSSTNSILIRPRSSDILSSNTAPSVNSVAWQSVSVQGRGNVPRTWNSCDYNPVDPGLAFLSGGLNLPFESGNIWPLPSLVQRAQQHQQQPCSSSPSSASSKAIVSSSVLNFEMELPSNQSYYGNCTSVLPEEEKIAGMKRPYPFSPESPPGPSFYFKLPPPILHPISRSDESASFGNGATMLNSNTSQQNFREGPSISNCALKKNSEKSIKENGVANEEFLTLAPPATTMACPQLKSKPPPAYLAFPNFEPFKFHSLPCQGLMEDPMPQPGPNVQPYYSFLPPAMTQNAQATKTIHKFNGGETGGSVDLNLKL